MIVRPEQADRYPNNYILTSQHACYGWPLASRKRAGRGSSRNGAGACSWVLERSTLSLISMAIILPVNIRDRYGFTMYNVRKVHSARAGLGILIDLYLDCTTDTTPNSRALIPRHAQNVYKTSHLLREHSYAKCTLYRQLASASRVTNRYVDCALKLEFVGNVQRARMEILSLLFILFCKSYQQLLTLPLVIFCHSH